MKRSHRVEKITFHIGDSIVVIDRADPTLPESYLGRHGRIVEFLPYQGVGDDPMTDPFILVKHATSMGKKTTTQCYWSDEIAPAGTAVKPHPVKPVFVVASMRTESP